MAHPLFRIFAAALPLLLSPAAPAAPWQAAPSPLTTRWAAQVSPTNALPEYPRPQMVRSKWQNLNGLWDYALTEKSATAAPASFDSQILVPFVYESALSGIGKPSVPNQRLWYHRTFTIPADWAGQRILLHFGAVNWESTVAVNGHALGQHQGGYDAFTYEITGFLKPGANDLVVSAWNPVRADTPEAQVLGKQRLRPGGIFYTAATGIWQTVWLEPVPGKYITGLKITPDVDGQSVHVTVQTESNAPVTVRALDGKNLLGAVTGQANTELHLPISNPHLWSPEDPYLYQLEVSFPDSDEDAAKTGLVDHLQSYFAMRKIALGKDAQGRNRIFLNGKFVFQMGVLDQGYWPDGIYTAPTDEALRSDIEATKKLGFNLSRKHAKVEPDRWYYWTDKLGLLVWQDMPQMFAKENTLTDTAKAQFETEWRREIAEFYNHPSIVVWTTFNEGWGQHDTDKIVDLTRQLDPTRLVNNASGWTDKNVGDIHDTHHYPEPGCEPPSATRASVNGEFGGLGMKVDGHMWSKEAWGYQGVYSKAYSLTRKYQQLLKVVYKLVDDRGLSAAVYTQLTDVEHESNGLLTYDRAVMKPDLAIVSAANQGKFPPLPPDPNPDLVPTAVDEPIIWHYTTEKPAEDWFQPAFNDTAWKSGSAVFGHNVSGIRTPWQTPDIWIRREFTLPESIPADLVFLIQHDEDAQIYLNGILAGSVTGFVGDYVRVPVNEAGRKALKPGKNTIAVHCINTIGGQGIDVGITAAAK